MPRKQQGWITFQSSPEERQILEEYCQQSQRTKTEILRQLVRDLGRSQSPPLELSENVEPENSGTDELGDFPVKISILPNSTPTLRISARNVIKAKVKQVTFSTVSAEVVLAITSEIELVSVITKTSAEQLNLAIGKEVYAVIKANNIMILDS